jgi:hypothetical protein
MLYNTDYLADDEELEYLFESSEPSAPSQQRQTIQVKIDLDDDMSDSWIIYLYFSNSGQIQNCTFTVHV